MEVEEEREEEEEEKERENDSQHPTTLNEESDNDQESVDDPATAVTYTCTVCRRNFTCTDELAEHAEKEHTDTVKLRKCNYCRSQFVQSVNLTRHIASVHVDRPRPFVCELDICRQRFSSVRTLAEHRKWHMVTANLMDHQKYVCLVPESNRTYFTMQ